MRFTYGIVVLLAACGFARAASPSSRPRPLPAAPDGVLVEQNLPFLEAGREQKLDLYRPAKRPEGERSPAVVAIHGGGWVGGDKAAPREYQIGTTLALRGYVVVSINYQLQPPRWPTNLHDCKNAVRFLRANAERYGIDPDRIGVIGGSAGGHLALMVAYTTDVPGLEPEAPYPGVSSRVSAVVNLYGITDVAARRKTDPDGKPVGPVIKKVALLPVTVDEDPQLYKLASPVTHASKDVPPTLILHGTKDQTVDRDQATALAQTLKAAGAEYELMMIEGAGHSFDLTTWRKQPLPQDLRPVVIEFFDKHLRKQ
jgi:acetyl esterase/lipase